MKSFRTRLDDYATVVQMRAEELLRRPPGEAFILACDIYLRNTPVPLPPFAELSQPKDH